VADGVVKGCCRARKTFANVQAFFLEVIGPEAMRRGVSQIGLILDNGSTHAPKQLEAGLKAQQQEPGWSFTVEGVWLPKYASWLDQIEIWFSVLQRKVLTPNHFADLKALQQRILEFIAHYNHAAQPIQWSYTVTQLVEKFATNERNPVLRTLRMPINVPRVMHPHPLLAHKVGMGILHLRVVCPNRRSPNRLDANILYRDDFPLRRQQLLPARQVSGIHPSLPGHHERMEPRALNLLLPLRPFHRDVHDVLSVIQTFPDETDPG
jgi:transposase